METKNGDKFWIENDVSHRTYSLGTRTWKKNGLTHGIDNLPAVVYVNGDKEWWTDGVHQRSVNARAIETIYAGEKRTMVIYSNGTVMSYKKDGKTVDKVIGPTGKLLFDIDSNEDEIKMKKINENKIKPSIFCSQITL